MINEKSQWNYHHLTLNLTVAVCISQDTRYDLFYFSFINNFFNACCPIFYTDNELRIVGELTCLCEILYGKFKFPPTWCSCLFTTIRIQRLVITLEYSECDNIFVKNIFCLLGFDLVNDKQRHVRAVVLLRILRTK